MTDASPDPVNPEPVSPEPVDPGVDPSASGSPAVPADAPSTSRLRAAALVVIGLAIAGATVGALWAWIAPPARAVIALTRAGDRVQAYVGSESDHLFVSAALMLAMPSVLAVVAAVLVWQWRAHRGPAMVIALSIGAACAAAAAAGTGAALAHLRHGLTTLEGAPVSPEHRVFYYNEAPSVFFGHAPLQIAATILVPAAAAALIYALLTVAAVRDDLGGYPPEQPRFAAPAVIGPVTVDGGLPPVR